MVSTLFAFSLRILIFPCGYKGNSIPWMLSTACIDTKSYAIAERAYTNILVDVSNCVFERSYTHKGSSYDVNVVTGSCGGIAFVRNVDLKMKITSCLFFRCSAAYRGGAVYYECPTTNSECQMKNTCASECYAGNSYEGQFGFFLTRNTVNNLNKFEMVSINKVSNPNGYHSLVIYYGLQTLKHYNSSLNKCYVSGCTITDSNSNFEGVYCTFSHNTITYSTCIRLSGVSGDLSYINVVHNNCPSSDSGVVYVSNNGNYVMRNSIFSDNENKLFFIVSGSSLSLIDCFVSHTGVTIQGNILTSNNVAFIKSSTYIYELYNTFSCPTNVYTPFQTIKNTMNPTPELTQEETPENTMNPTPELSQEETLENSNSHSSELTQGKTVHYTFYSESQSDNHNLPTPYRSYDDKTPHRSFPPNLDSYNQEYSSANMGNQSDLFNNSTYILIILSSFGSSIIVFLMFIIYICKRKENESSSSISSIREPIKTNHMVSKMETKREYQYEF